MTADESDRSATEGGRRGDAAGDEPRADDGAVPEGALPDPGDLDPPPGASAHVERYAVSIEASREAFLAAAKVYARDVVDRHGLSVDVSALSWEVSTRAKRRAGAVRYRDGDPETVVLTWAQFRERGWAAAAETVRHELAHVHLLNEADEPGHGPAFRRLADRLATTVHCDRFAEPRYWVVCVDCDARLARYRRSKLVDRPEEYRCGDCGGAFRVEPADGD